MTEYDTTEVEGTDLESRDARALTEYMTVLAEGGDIYTVVGQNGGTYTVDAREGRCTCPDAEYRDATCKHQRRVAFATGERSVPAWVDTDAVDPQLGEHVDGGPRQVATDGGSDVIDAGDDGGRPDDCDCWDWNTDLDLPCWPCYRNGFDTPASAE